VIIILCSVSVEEDTVYLTLQSVDVCVCLHTCYKINSDVFIDGEITLPLYCTHAHTPHTEMSYQHSLLNLPFVTSLHCEFAVAVVITNVVYNEIKMVELHF